MVDFMPDRVQTGSRKMGYQAIRLLGYKAMRNIRVFIDREKSYDWKWNVEV
jgi:hypothetical protein